MWNLDETGWWTPLSPFCTITEFVGQLKHQRRQVPILLRFSRWLRQSGKLMVEVRRDWRQHFKYAGAGLASLPESEELVKHFTEGGAGGFVAEVFVTGAPRCL